MFMATVGETFDSGRLIRLWCFRCARGGTMSPEAMARYWTRDLRTWRPICKQCRRDDQTIAIPATDPWFAEDGTPANAGSLVVEQFFHDMRARRKRGPGIGRPLSRPKQG